MAGLQRSEVSFRRQGSSGLVWDDKLWSGSSDLKTQPLIREGDGGSSRPARLTIVRNPSNGGRAGFRAGKVQPAIEPLSPRVSACGLCCAFGKDKSPRRPPHTGKRMV